MILTSKLLKEKSVFEVSKDLSKNIPIYVIKNFIKKDICKKLVKLCSNKNLHKYNRLKVGKKFDFFSIDVLPSNVETNRIYRRFQINKKTINKYIDVKKLFFWQNKIAKKNSKTSIKMDIVHYPKGGGFFDWHIHDRYPTNYGMIVNLSAKGKDYKKGSNHFKIKNKEINLKKYKIGIGDLILFRYDINHSISEIDPEKNLTFDSGGRWTLITYATNRVLKKQKDNTVKWVKS